MARTIAEVSGEGAKARVERLGRITRVLETRSTSFGYTPVRAEVLWRGDEQPVEVDLRADNIVPWDMP
jgi:hypothetical protein